MEGYNYAMIPHLSQLSPLKRIATTFQDGSSSEKGTRKELGAADSKKVKQEKDRKEKMAEYFSLLHSMVPTLLCTPKATRENIVAETISYIKNLEVELQNLEDVKNSILEAGLSHCRKCSTKPSVTTASFSNGFAFLGIQCALKHCLLAKIFQVFEENQAEVLVGTIWVDDLGILNLMGKFKVGSSNGSEIIEIIKKEIQEC